MREKIRKDKDNVILEALLHIACDEAMRIEMESLPSDEELKAMYPGTAALDKRIRSLINKEFNKSRRIVFLRSFARAAAVFCMFTILSAGILMAAPASRNAILNYIMDIRKDHIVFDFGNEPIDIEDAVFGYAPEGFALTTRRVTDYAATYIYENADGSIIIMNRRWGPSSRIGIDHEYRHFSEIELQGREAFLFESIHEGDLSTIMWIDGEYVFTINTSLDAKLLLTLAEIYMGR